MPSSGGVRPSPTGTTEQADLARVEPHAAGDRSNQRGLAGAVRTEQREKLALAKLERGAVERLDGAEGFPGVGDGQHVHVCTLRSAPWRFLDDPGEWRTGSGGWRSLNAVEIGTGDGVEIRDQWSGIGKSLGIWSNALSDPRSLIPDHGP